MIDLSKLPDAEVEALSRGDVGRLSDATLQLVMNDNTAKAQPSKMQMLMDAARGAKNYLSDPNTIVGGPLNAYGTIFKTAARPIEAAGRYINSGNEMLGQALQGNLPGLNHIDTGPLAPIGKAYQAVSPFLNPVPTSDLGVALTPLMAKDIGNSFAQGAGKFMGQAVGAESAPVAQGLQKLNQATPVQQAIATALSAANRVKPNQLAAVIANPGILSETTPTTSQVSKLYEDAFEKAGMTINDARYKFLTGLSRPLRDQQISKAESIVDMALDPVNPAKLRDGLTDTEAFIARTASSKLERSVVASSNPAYRMNQEKQTEMLDDFLENSKMPDIRNLNRLWFMAKTKEAMLEPLPLNKQGSANALSTLLMAAQFKKAAEQATEGSLIKAAGNAASGALMSPLIGGQAIQAYGGIKNNPGALAALYSNYRANNPESNGQ